MKLVRPSREYADDFLAMAAEFQAEGDTRFDRALELADVDGYLRMCEDDEQRDDAHALVPQTHFWLVTDGRVLGSCRLRHRLSDSLWRDGGHIGYDVRPSARSRGHATALLALALDEARAIGHPWVLLTIEEENVASIRVAEKNGGTCIGRVAGTGTMRFLIELKNRAAAGR